MPGTGHDRADLTPPPADAGDETRAQALRDLRWLLLSPPLLNTTPGAFSAEVQQFDAQDTRLIEDWLDRLDHDAAAPGAPWQDTVLAASGTAGRPLPLGRRAEHLLKFFLQHGPTHRLLASHQVVLTAQGSTQGEIDFLVEDRHGERWHWELAVKFYLCQCIAPVVDAGDLVGPDGRDRLSVKLKRLFEHQLRLQPPAPWGATSWRRAAFVRGWLFHPAGHPMPTCAAVNPAHLRGAWTTPRHADSPDLTGWLPLPRAHWLSPACRPGPPAPSPRPVDTGRAQLWVHLQPQADGRGWRETERCFVVPDDPQWRVPR